MKEFTSFSACKIFVDEQTNQYNRLIKIFNDCPRDGTLDGKSKKEWMLDVNQTVSMITQMVTHARKFSDKQLVVPPKVKLSL